jgi:hypothetical protein
VSEDTVFFLTDDDARAAGYRDRRKKRA